MIYVNDGGVLPLLSPLIRPPEGSFYNQKGGRKTHKATMKQKGTCVDV